MKKQRISILFLLICLCFVMGACGKQTIAETPEEKTKDMFEKETEEETDAETAVETDEQDEAVVEYPMIKTQIVREVSEWDEELGVILINGSYDEICLMDDNYPKLKKTIEKINADNKEEIITECSGFTEDAKEFFIYMEPEYATAWEANNTAYVKRADENVCSVLFAKYRYFGGAHPSSWYESHNIDVKTGAELTLRDVVKDYDGLYNEVLAKLEAEENRFKELYGESLVYYENYREIVEDYFYSDNGEFPLAFTVCGDGIEVYFDAYTIGPYSSGDTILFFPFEEYPDMFSNKVTDYTETFSKEIMQFQSVEMDVDGDGEAEKIRLDAYYYEEDFYVDYVIRCNDYSLDVTMFGEFASARLMKNTNGKVYLYLENSEMNDYHYISVYSFENDVPTYVGEPGAAFRGYFVEDTQSFYMNKKVDFLGTYTGYRKYRMGEDGMPVPIEQDYQLEQTWINGLVSTKELKVTVYADENATEGKEDILPVGTTFYPYATDEATYVKCRLDNGKVCVIHAEKEDYQIYIDGVSEYDCFEMVPYAG